jgi:hypothetical protein
MIQKASYTFSMDSVYKNTALDMFFKYAKNIFKTNPCGKIGRLAKCTYGIKYDFRNAEKKFEDQITLLIDKIKKESLKPENVAKTRLLKKLNKQLDELSSNASEYVEYTKEDNYKSITSSEYRKVLTYVNEELSKDLFEGYPVFLSNSLGYLQIARLKGITKRVSHFIDNKPVYSVEEYLYKLHWFRNNIINIKYYKCSSTGSSGDKKRFRKKLADAIMVIKNNPNKSILIPTYENKK